jgi:hypothetical protein
MQGKKKGKEGMKRKWLNKRLKACGFGKGNHISAPLIRV